MYRVLRTIRLEKNLARSPGDELTQDDIDEIPVKIRARRVQGLLDRGKIIWEDDPKQKLKDAKKLILADKRVKKEAKEKKKEKKVEESATNRDEKKVEPPKEGD